MMIIRLSAYMSPFSVYIGRGTTADNEGNMPGHFDLDPVDKHQSRPP